MQTPSNFLGVPGHNSFRPEPVGAAAPVGQYVAPRVVALPQPLPTITVRPNGDVTLSKTLVQSIPHLHGAEPEKQKEGSLVNIVVPALRGAGWYLDTRPKPGVGRHLPHAREVARFRIPAPSRTHFIIPAIAAAPGQFGGAQGTTGFRATLLFTLGPEVEGHPGYFELLPLR